MIRFFKKIFSPVKDISTSSTQASAGEFFRTASEAEKRKLIMGAINGANEDKRKLIERYNQS